MIEIKMAEGRYARQDDVVCRYFMNSGCRDGDRCFFSHDGTRGTPDSVCRYYLRGTCDYGRNCRYDHVRVNKLSNFKSRPHNLRHSAGHSRHSDSTTRDDTYNYSRNQSRFFSSQDCSTRLLYSLTTDDSVCRNYLRGRCVYGSNCRYHHVRLLEETNSSSYLHNDGHSRHSDSTNRDATNNYSRNQSRFFSSQDCSTTDDSICRNYLRGRCVYGSNCRYDHVRVLEETSSSSYLHNDGHSAGPSRPSSNSTRCESNKQTRHQPKFNEVNQNTKDTKFTRKQEQKEVHVEHSENYLEKDAAFAFAIQRSMEKTCGICMDVVLEKELFAERKFGILEKCNHVFCFSCISKWRNCKQNSATTKACPECRTISDFVLPSEYFVDTEEEKKKLIEHKKALKQKNCKYFKKGKGRCRFGEACLYLHANPDGSNAEHPIPTSRRQQDEDDESDSSYEIFNYIHINESIHPFHSRLFYDWNEFDTEDEADDMYMEDEFDYMDEFYIWSNDIYGECL